jgi:hypothetical protein
MYRAHLTLEDYQQLCVSRNVPCPIDMEREKLVEFCETNIEMFQKKTSEEEMRVFSEIIAIVQKLDVDQLILEKSKFGFLGIALAYVGFEQLESDYMFAEMSELLPTYKLAVVEIRNGVLYAMLDKSSVSKKNIFKSAIMKLFMDDLYIHPYFNNKYKNVVEKVHVENAETLLAKTGATDTVADDAAARAAAMAAAEAAAATAFAAAAAARASDDAATAST